MIGTSGYTGPFYSRSGVAYDVEGTAREAAPALPARESALAWELRGLMISRKRATLLLSDRCEAERGERGSGDVERLGRVRGTIDGVSATDAYVIVRDAPGEPPLHVPLEDVLGIKNRRHFSEPDVEPTSPLSLDDPFEGQTSADFGEETHTQHKEDAR